MLGVLGDLVEDIVVWLGEPVRNATDTEVSLYRRRGGSAANVAVFAAQRYPTRFLGCVGVDTVGDGLLAEMNAAGVDTAVQRRGSTGAVVVLIDEHGERTMLPDRAAAVLAEPFDEGAVAGLEHLHVPAYAFATEPLASTARKLIRRVPRVSVDASSTGMLHRYGKQRFLQLLAKLGPRWLFANRDEAEYLGLARDAEAGPALDAVPWTTVVVKDGQRPTTLLAAGEDRLRVAVPPVEQVCDRTGAGDAFAAGFLTAFLDGAEPQRCCACGHDTAARVLRSPGASLPPS